MRIALLCSGGGSTLEKILLACKDGRLPGVVPALVIASAHGAGGIEKALRAGFLQDDVVVRDPLSFPNKEAFGESILSACHARGVDFVGQYGWLPWTPLNVIKAFEGRMTNQHPGPLDPGRPDFGGQGMYGRRVHAARLHFIRALWMQDPWTEVVCQRVAEKFDQGAVLNARRVPILPDDDVAALQARALPVEHEVQIETLAAFAAGRVKERRLETPLIRPEEEPLLLESKRYGRKEFPTG